VRHRTLDGVAPSGFAETRMSSSTALDALVVAAREGDARALGELVERVRFDLRSRFRFLVRAWRVDWSGDDLLDEAVVGALRGLSSLRAADYRTFRGWCAKIALNRLRMLARAARVRALPMEGEGTARSNHRGRSRKVPRSVDELPAPEDRPAGGFVGPPLRCELRRLSHAQRAAFVLREGLGLPWRTIGFVLSQRPRAAARVLHQRARLRLGERVRG